MNVFRYDLKQAFRTLARAAERRRELAVRAAPGLRNTKRRVDRVRTGPRAGATGKWVKWSADRPSPIT